MKTILLLLGVLTTVSAEAYSVNRAIPFQCSDGTQIGVIVRTDIGISAYDSRTTAPLFCAWEIVSGQKQTWLEGTNNEVEDKCRKNDFPGLSDCLKEFNRKCVYQEQNPPNALGIKEKPGIRENCLPKSEK